MKRSEMIQILKNSVIKWMNYPEEDGPKTDEEMYSLVLQDLENAGMIPPIVEEDSFKLLPSGEMTYAEHYWEELRKDLKND